MVTVSRVGVLSVGIIFGILSAIGGLLAGLWMTGWAYLIGDFMPYYDLLGRDMGFFKLVFSGMAVVIFPIIYGVFGFLSGIISAALYNFCSEIVGGIKLEIKTDTT